MGNPNQFADSRSRAKALGAATARDVMLGSPLAFVYFKMSAVQIGQMQRVLDGTVLDPVIYKEANTVYQRGTKIYGQLVVHDPASVRRSERIMRDYVTIDASSKRIRLDYRQLMDAKALKPASDNPDEAEYWAKVRKWLDNVGVWLRFEPKLVRDPTDPSRRMYSTREFDVWLSLGPAGDAIPVKAGRIDRESLIGTTVVGAGYYREVDNGAAQLALEREIRRLDSAMDDAKSEHEDWARHRRNTNVVVVRVSDAMGGANFPSLTLWKQPQSLVLRARQLSLAGSLFGAHLCLITAAMLTRYIALMLDRAIDDTKKGAGRAIVVQKVAIVALSIAATAGASQLLAVRAAATAARVGGAAGSEAAVTTQLAQNIARYEAANPALARELASMSTEGVANATRAGVQTYKVGAGGL